MSESITTPADAPAPTEGPGQGAAPPALTDAPLSISEAARLLASQRRGQQAAGSGQQAAAAPAAAPQGPRDAADEMAEALGLKPGQAPAAAPEAAQQTGADGFELDGRRYSAAELKSLVAAGTDYTRKTQALAEQQRTIQSQQEALATVLPLLQPELARLQEQINAAPPPDPQLAETDPQTYLRQLAAFQQAQHNQQRLQQISALNQQAMAQAMRAALERSNAALAAEFPQWADPVQRDRWQHSIVDWATSQAGYSRDELKGLVDHRHLLTMMKAMSWDRMREGAKSAAPVPRVQSAALRGSPPPAPSSQLITDAESRFTQRPNVRNAAALLSARRANGGLNGGSR